MEFMKCPICKKTTVWEGNPDRPFCSERCRIIDLGNWSAEDYRVETALPDTEEKAEIPHE
ncbi:MAG: DNA gyrase inhibitor YacG [Acidobacteria bacterium]|nr:DNA gyrase inhibitor YacG [Acidobacteriota bacterium]